MDVTFDPIRIATPPERYITDLMLDKLHNDAAYGNSARTEQAWHREAERLLNALGFPFLFAFAREWTQTGYFKNEIDLLGFERSEARHRLLPVLDAIKARVGTAKPWDTSSEAARADRWARQDGPTYLEWMDDERADIGNQ